MFCANSTRGPASPRRLFSLHATNRRAYLVARRLVSWLGLKHIATCRRYVLMRMLMKTTSHNNGNKENFSPSQICNRKQQNNNDGGFVDGLWLSCSAFIGQSIPLMSLFRDMATQAIRTRTEQVNGSKSDGRTCPSEMPTRVHYLKWECSRLLG